MIQNVQALHDMVAEMHQAYYDMGGADQQIDMMLCAVVDGRVGFLTIDADTREEWYAVAAALLTRFNASMYCVACEAWMARSGPIDDPVNGLMPSQRMDRCEVVATAAADRAGNRASSIKIIHRHDAGERTGAVRSLEDFDGLDMADGRMFELFEMI